MEHKQIFIGGWCHTGSRLLVRILQDKGYNSFKSKCNKMEDYLGEHFAPIFKSIHDEGNPAELFEIIDSDTKNVDKWVIKHGHQIMICNELKQKYPDSIFIGTMRHPVDALIHPDPNYKSIGGMGCMSPPLDEKFKFYKEWYKYLDNCDYIVKLEDLVLDTENTVKNLLTFLGCDNTVNVSHIIGLPSKNVGKWKKESEYLQHPEIVKYIKELGY